MVDKKKPGTFVAGTSGNSRGRPPTQELTIRQQQLALESAIRRSVPKERVIALVSGLFDKAEQGDLKAAQTLLPYFLSKTSNEEAKNSDTPMIVIKVENATAFAVAQQKGEKGGVTVDAEFTKVKD